MARYERLRERRKRRHTDDDTVLDQPGVLSDDEHLSVSCQTIIETSDSTCETDDNSTTTLTLELQKLKKDCQDMKSNL